MDLGGGAEVKIKFFSEYGHVAYQIKADDVANIMVAIFFCPQTHPRPRGWGQKVKLYIFLKVVMLHIKLKLTTLAATW